MRLVSTDGHGGSVRHIFQGIMSHLDKAALRGQFIAERDFHNTIHGAAAGPALARTLLALIPPGLTIAGYRATNGEIDVTPAMEQLAENGHKLCLPVTAPNQSLVFKSWAPGDALVRGRYNIEIPLETAPEIQPDLIIVPMVAFDMAGNRLGYGGGYYDRTIAALRQSGKNVLIVGAAYAIQGVQELPREAHDQRLDAIATEQGALKLQSPQARVS